MSQQDVESLRRIYDAFSRWDVEELVADLAHDIEWSLPDALPWGGTRHGHDGVLSFASVSQDHVEGRWADPDRLPRRRRPHGRPGPPAWARQGHRPGFRGRVRPRLDDDRRRGLAAARLLRHRADHGRPRVADSDRYHDQVVARPWEPLGDHWRSRCAVAALAGVLSAPAPARTIDVFHGEWIQGAVKRADGRRHDRRPPGRLPPERPDQEERLDAGGRPGDQRRHRDQAVALDQALLRRTDGICVLAHRTNSGNRVRTSGTEISGFLIRGFRGSGLFALGAKNTVIRDNSFINNDEYGGFALVSKRTKFLHNRAKGSGEAGFYVGSSPNARAVLRGNRARRNGDFGFFLRDAAHGVAINNQVARNCMGIALVNTGEPGGVHDWKVRGNEVLKNQAQLSGRRRRAGDLGNRDRPAWGSRKPSPEQHRGREPPGRSRRRSLRAESC